MDEVVSSTTTNGVTKTVAAVPDEANKEAEVCSSQQSKQSPLEDKKTSTETEVTI